MSKARAPVQENDTTRIETLFLDAGGVLLFPNWQRVCATLKKRGIEVDMALLAASEVRVRYDLDTNVTAPIWKDGQGDWQFLDRVLTVAGVPTSPERAVAVRALRRYHATRNLWETVPADVVPALRRLRSLGLTLVVVSNSNGTVRKAIARVGISNELNAIVDSHEEGVAKPNPKLFTVALARAHARRETTLHVGDMYRIDVLGARAAGLHAILFDASGMYGGYDCPKVGSLHELADRIEANDVR